MTDRPIIMSAPMVRAILVGRKTMTRRLAWRMSQGDRAVPFAHPVGTPWQKVKPGDRLWVRESFATAWFDSGLHAYRADWTGEADDVLKEPKWTPSIHMPRSASRLTLLVTATKIEPLLDISEEDARREGFERGELDDGHGPRDIGGGWTVTVYPTLCSAAGMFQVTWAKLHPDWDGFSSPEVVAISFEPKLANIDSLKVAA